MSLFIPVAGMLMPSSDFAAKRFFSASSNDLTRNTPLLRQAFTGDSVIIDPRGEIIAGPAAGETMVVADCPLAAVRAAKVAFDCSGHSGRGDQLRFWNQALGAPEEQDQNAGFGQGMAPDGGSAPAPDEPAFDRQS